MSEPFIFTSPASFLEAVLAVVRARLQLAVEPNPTFAERELDEHELRRAADATVRAGVELPLCYVRHRVGLSATEELVTWILLAHELDADCRRLVRQLNTEEVSDPTLDTLRRAVYGTGDRARAAAELAPEGTLRALRLVEATEHDDDAPEYRKTVSLSRRVLQLAFGDVALDPDVRALATIPPAGPSLGELVLPAGAADELLDAVRHSNAMTVVVGAYGTGRKSALLAAASAAGRDVLVADMRKLSTDRAMAMRELTTVRRECLLLARCPLLAHVDALARTEGSPDRLDLVEELCRGQVLATAATRISRRWPRPPRYIELASITGAQRSKLWHDLIPGASVGDAELLATMYPLAPAFIVEVSAAIRDRASESEITGDDLAAAVRGVVDDKLTGLATRMKCSQATTDLVLAEDQATALFELVARIRQRHIVYETWGFADKVGRGLGIAALFSGPPGTGKTMAAGLLAKELGVDLYQVDLSKVVSKWVGETERNLATLFDAAEAGHAMLLFDEADALFGKRIDVKSSNDRHANQEVNYLLQRLESFSGVCILTSNHEASIDEAFRRRLAVHVRFAMPELEERKLLWRTVLPAKAPVAKHIDVAELAQRFEMSGGYIRNAVLRAAFLAADSGRVIDSELLGRAAQLEYEAMGKVVARS